MHASLIALGLAAVTAASLARPHVDAAPREAQTSIPIPQETTPSADVHPALRALGAAVAEETFLQGSIEAIVPERLKRHLRNGPDWAMHIGLPAFTGEVWVWRSQRGETLIVSRGRAPGFTIYRDGAIHLMRAVTLDGEAMDLSVIAKDLWRAVHLEQLVTDLRGSTFKRTSPAGGEEHVYRADVPALAETKKRRERVVFLNGGKGVLERTFEVTLRGESGPMRSIALDVERESAIRFGGANGEDDNDGVVTRIELDVVARGEALPERVARALKEMRELANEIEAR